MLKYINVVILIIVQLNLTAQNYCHCDTLINIQLSQFASIEYKDYYYDNNNLCGDFVQNNFDCAIFSIPDRVQIFNSDDSLLLDTDWIGYCNGAEDFDCINAIDERYMVNVNNLTTFNQYTDIPPDFSINATLSNSYYLRILLNSTVQFFKIRVSKNPNATTAINIKINCNPNLNIDINENYYNLEDTIICKNSTFKLPLKTLPEGFYYDFENEFHIQDDTIINYSINNEYNSCIYEYNYNISTFNQINIIQDNSVISNENIYYENDDACDNYDYLLINGDINDCDFAHFVQSDTTLFIEGIDLNGCVNLDTFNIFAIQKNNIFVPNIFSPNFDGNNDDFIIFYNGNYVKEVVHLTIYTRWGDIIFVGDSGTWNKGHNFDAGVYIYKFEYINYKGIEEEIIGDITLIK